LINRNERRPLRAGSSAVAAAIEPIEAVVSSGVAEKVEDVGTEEPAVTGFPVCEPPVATVATVAFEEHLTDIVVAQIILKQRLLQPKDP
jgi:hypothetical protein